MFIMIYLLQSLKTFKKSKIYNINRLYIFYYILRIDINIQINQNSQNYEN